MKKTCAKYASKLIHDGMVVGLGGGSTIQYLIDYVKDKDIQVVTPSVKTALKAQKEGLPVLNTQFVDHIDIAFDGCDEVDQNLNAYKSGGGIHTKEKIIAKMAQEYVLLVDETKVVEKLDCKVPIVLEIVPEAASYVTKEAKKLGAKVKERNEKLLELYFEGISDLKKLDQDLKQITGVIEISLFYQIAAKVVVAGTDGIKIIES